jgi:serine/threonine-protein kinase
MNGSQSPDPWIGRSVGERQRYFVKKRIGGGGMGDVFLAIDTLLGQPVALKLLNARLATGDMRKRFEREVAVCAALQSDHIVQVTDYGITPEGYPFYVMEYLRGQTLGHLLRRENSLSIQRAVNIVTQVCSGLCLAHQGVKLRRDGPPAYEHVKVVHRDLKPDNIFLISTALGEFVKLLDFGIAKVCSNQADYTNTTNIFLGTFQYAAPEQFQLEKNLDERADIYSLSVILYEMLAGTDPFNLSRKRQAERPSVIKWAIAHMSTPPIPLREQSGCEQLPAELEAIVMQCLQKAPDQRPASVMELTQALQVAVIGSGDRNLAMSAHAPSQPAIDMPSLSTPTLLNQQTSITPAATQSATQVATQAVVPIRRTGGHKPTTLANRSVFRRNPGLLLTGVAAIAAALGLGVYSVQSSVVLSRQMKQVGVPESPSSTQPPAQPEPSHLQQPEMAAAKSLSGHTDTVWAVAVSPDGQILASGSYDKTIRLWDIQTGKLQRTLTGHTDAVRAIAFSPDGQMLASGSGDKTIKIWHTQTGELARTLYGHVGPIWAIATSPDAKTLASGSYDGVIKTWNLQTGELLQTLPEHYDSIWAVTISPDGKTLASGSYDGTVKIWDLQTGKLLRTLAAHAEGVRSVAINPDGKTLASGSWDKTINIWNLQTGELLQTLSGHRDRVLSVAFSPEGKSVASSSVDRTINIWDLQTGRSLRTLTGHTDWVISVAFSPDGKTLVSGSKDKTVKIWPMNLDGEV